MADGAPRTEIVAEQAADRLYIIDTRNGVERRILLDWIHSTSGDDEPVWASLDIEDGDHALPVDVLQARLDGAASRQVVPLRVAWRIPGFDKDRALKFRHLLFGDPRHPGALRARLILLRDRRRAQILVGEAAIGKLLFANGLSLLRHMGLAEQATPMNLAARRALLMELRGLANVMETMRLSTVALADRLPGSGG